MGFENFAAESVDNTKPVQASLGVGAWIKETVVNPAVNAAIIDSYNVVSCAVKDVSRQHLSLGKMDELSVNKAEKYSASWVVESAAGGIGSLVPYVVAGELTGGAMRGTGRLFEVEGAKASFLASERVAQLVGAGVYAGMKRPDAGETRGGNAVSTVAGFALFGAGDLLSTSVPLLGKAGVMPLLGRAGVRLGTGMVAGGAQTELASLLGHGQVADKDKVIQNGVAGAFLNLGLGTGQDMAGRAVDAVNMKIGRGAPVVRYARLSDLNGKSERLDSLVKASPLTRVQHIDSADAMADHAQNKVFIPRSDDGSLLGHELAHLTEASNKRFENGFQEAGRLLDLGKGDQPDQPWLEFRQTRLQQELAARKVQNDIADQLGLPHLRASISADEVPQLRTATGQTYEQNWLSEFKKFQIGDHSFRPTVDFMDGGDGGWGKMPDGTLERPRPIRGDFGRTPRENELGWGAESDKISESHPRGSNSNVGKKPIDDFRSASHVSEYGAVARAARLERLQQKWASEPFSDSYIGQLKREFVNEPTEARAKKIEKEEGRKRAFGGRKH